MLVLDMCADQKLKYRHGIPPPETLPLSPLTPIHHPTTHRLFRPLAIVHMQAEVPAGQGLDTITYPTTHHRLLPLSIGLTQYNATSKNQHNLSLCSKQDTPQLQDILLKSFYDSRDVQCASLLAALRVGDGVPMQARSLWQLSHTTSKI